MTSYATALSRFSLSYNVLRTAPGPLRNCYRASRHIMKMAKMRPDEVLLQPLPSPTSANVHCSAIGSSSPMSLCENDRLYRLIHASEKQKIFKRVVVLLSERLRMYYPKRIEWPAEQPHPIPPYYLNVLVLPVVQLLSQLRAPFISDPVKFKTSEIEDDVAIVSFYSNNFQFWDKPVSTPSIIFTPHGFLNEVSTTPDLSPKLSRLLRRVWNIDSQARILCTDLDTLTIFHPLSSPTSRDVAYEQSVVHGDLIRLRIVIAAYLHVSLPRDMYIHHPPYSDIVSDVPEGPPIDPYKPMQTDEEVFASHRRHSDFDFRTLARDEDRALQFFRWKEIIKTNISPIFASRGDLLLGMTHGFIRRNQGLSPCYPVENLPMETTVHIQSVRRSCPMGPLLHSFLSSNTFTLRLLEDMTPSKGGGLCRTYKCDIRSIDGDEMEDALPVLCLKLFDDRFFPMQTPSETQIGDQSWWIRYRTAENDVRNEDAAYKKLQFVQGSLIPWFYGSHLFTLPDGHQVYGILMELVPAQPLSSGIAGTLSPVQQKQLIRSTRHAICALQCADVSQNDWHPGQILVHQHSDHPDAQDVNCVLVDFSRTTQSIDEEHHKEDDFGCCLITLMRSDVGLDPEMVWQNFSPREFWDIGIVGTMIGGEHRTAIAVDPYEFVYNTQPI